MPSITLPAKAPDLKTVITIIIAVTVIIMIATGTDTVTDIITMIAPWSHFATLNPAWLFVRRVYPESADLSAISLGEGGGG